MAEFRTRGHPAALAVVRRAIVSDRPPHALLLVGPAQVGKTTLALDLASGLLCLADSSADRPCRTCVACRKVEHANHPDLHLVAPDGAGGQIRLAQAQGLIAALALLPLEGRFRVAIVEQAQRLNPDAQNALLKTLEEPPARVCLILAADESGSLLSTLVSRCARLRLGPVFPDALAGILAEQAGLDAAQSAVLARTTGGRPGAALALARQPDVLVARARLARTLLALLPASRRQRLAAVPGLLDDGAALAGPPARRTASAARAPAERRAALAQLLAVWRDVARDLAVAVHGGRDALRQPDLLDELDRVAGAIAPAGLASFLVRLDDMERALESYANPELMLDGLLLAWPHAASAS